MSYTHKRINGERVKLKASEVEEIKAKELENQPTLEERRKELKEKLFEDMSLTIVEINSKTFWADPASEQNFSGRIREMELSGKTSTKWIQGKDIFEVTLDELKAVVAEGTKINAALWDKFIEDVEKL
jgi:hypothetical protein